MKRRKIERTQLPEIFETANDIPYLDVDVGMGIDFGGVDFLFSSSSHKIEASVVTLRE